MSNHPLSRRRIPNVIRRRHEGFRHGRHQGLKAMCRHVRRTMHPPSTGYGRSRPGFQSRSSITCGQFLPPAYQPAESRASGKSCPYRTSKAMCPPRMGPETVARPGVARGTGIQHTVFNRGPEPGDHLVQDRLQDCIHRKYKATRRRFECD